MTELNKIAEKLFWMKKGINSPNTLSREERIAFKDELRAFVDGFVEGFDYAKNL